MGEVGSLGSLNGAQQKLDGRTTGKSFIPQTQLCEGHKEIMNCVCCWLGAEPGGGRSLEVINVSPTGMCSEALQRRVLPLLGRKERTMNRKGAGLTRIMH